MNTRKPNDEFYTPEPVYNTVLEWVEKEYGIDRQKVIRPFYKGNDYKSFDYTDKIVVDNPPFSQNQPILEYYLEHNIKFFLFAQFQTLFTVNLPVCYIVTKPKIKYENGQKIATSFITNLEPPCIRTAFDLQKELQGYEIKTKQSVFLDKHILTVSRIVRSNKAIKLSLDNVKHVRDVNGYKLFGAAFLVDDETANQFPSSYHTDADKFIELSEHEKEIVEELNVRRAVGDNWQPYEPAFNSPFAPLFAPVLDKSTTPRLDEPMNKFL